MIKTALQNVRILTVFLLLGVVALFVIPVSAQKPGNSQSKKFESQKSGSASRILAANYRSPGTCTKYRSAAVRRQCRR